MSAVVQGLQRDYHSIVRFVSSSCRSSLTYYFCLHGVDTIWPFDAPVGQAAVAVPDGWRDVGEGYCVDGDGQEKLGSNSVYFWAA